MGEMNDKIYINGGPLHIRENGNLVILCVFSHRLEVKHSELDSLIIELCAIRDGREASNETATPEMTADDFMVQHMGENWLEDTMTQIRGMGGE